MGWYQDLRDPIDPVCVEAALRTVTSDLNVWEAEKSEGDPLFPAGSVVSSFTYVEGATYHAIFIAIGKLPDGQVRYVNRWSKIGTSISSVERAKIVPLMKQADRAVSLRCQVHLGKTTAIS